MAVSLNIILQMCFFFNSFHMQLPFYSISVAIRVLQLYKHRNVSKKKCFRFYKMYFIEKKLDHWVIQIKNFFTSHESGLFSRASWSQWRPLDIPGTQILLLPVILLKIGGQINFVVCLVTLTSFLVVM